MSSAASSPPETDPMLDFDERDLLDLAEEAGFAEIHLDYEAEISTAATRHGVMDWETFVKSAGNPNIPTIEEAMDEVLTLEEIARVTTHLRPRAFPGRQREPRVNRERRIAVVTGAARGIGKKICLELAGRGYEVAANDLGTPEETTEELRSAGADALALPGDVADEASVRGMVETVMGEFGRADVLINNAGITAPLSRPRRRPSP